MNLTANVVLSTVHVMFVLGFFTSSLANSNNDQMRITNSHWISIDPNYPSEDNEKLNYKSDFCIQSGMNLGWWDTFHSTTLKANLSFAIARPHGSHWLVVYGNLREFACKLLFDTSHHM